MKKIIVGLSLAALVFASCASSPKAGSTVKVEAKAAPAYVVIDTKTMALGSPIPAWVETYTSDGITAVEKMDAYKDKMVFIGEENGTNLPGLKMWVEEFNIGRSMARYVSNRVKATYDAAQSGGPDTDVGRYQEASVKALSDATFSGARKEADFWVLKRFYKTASAAEREEYTMYVVVTINKADFLAQIQKIMDGVAPEKKVTKEQQSAIDRVKASVYESF